MIVASVLLILALVSGTAAVYGRFHRQEQLNHALAMYIALQDADQVRELLHQGADMRTRSWDLAHGKDVTPLMTGARRGHLALIRELLAAGADPNDRDRARHTALHYAVMGDQAEAIRILVGAGGEVDAKARGGWTPLHYAADMGSQKAAKALLLLGADASAENADGATALELARDGNQARIVRLLKPHSGGSTKRQ